jgi:hypothetical protein
VAACPASVPPRLSRVLGWSGEHIAVARLAGLPGGHPRTRDEFRSLLARHSFQWLVGAFVVLVLAVAALGAVVLWLYRDFPRESFWWWWKQCLLLVAGQSPDSGAFNDAFISSLIQVTLTLAGLVLPAIILGIIVFKAFISKEVFTSRRDIVLMKSADLGARDQRELEKCDGGPYCLAVRIYSSTRLALVEVKFRFYARIRERSPTGSKTVRNYELTVCKKEWPIALTHVPYTVLIPLLPEDVVEDRTSGMVELVAIQGNGPAAQSRLLLHISGNIPALNAPFFEGHWFETDSAVSQDPFGEIEVDYDLPGPRWEGWPEFGLAGE